MGTSQQHWSTLGILATLALGCACGPGQNEDDVTVEDLGNGVVQLHAMDGSDESTQIEDGTPGEAGAAIVNKARDCVYVQWCNEPGPSGTICRLREGCSYSDATVNECLRETRATCGSPVHPWYLF